MPKQKDVKSLTERQNKYINQIAQQVELAMKSKKTPKKVKACLYSVVLEASIESGLTLGDFNLVRVALPNIIDALGEDYGKGYLHSISAILRYDTDAVQEFYDKNLDRKDSTSPLYSETKDADTETLAVVLSALMHNDNLPIRLYNLIGDEINQVEDIHTPEVVLLNLQRLNAEEEKR